MKTNFLVFIALLLLLCGGFTACESDDPFSDPVPFSEYPINSSFRWDVDYNGRGNVIIINSEEDLKKHLTVAEYPTIDFSKQTLILVSGTETHGVGVTVTNIRQTSAHKYKLNAKMIHGLTAAICPWVAPVLTPKISDNSQIEVVMKDVN